MKQNCSLFLRFDFVFFVAIDNLLSGMINDLKQIFFEFFWLQNERERKTRKLARENFERN
jgi:hypothetical protein